MFNDEDKDYQSGWLDRAALALLIAWVFATVLAISPYTADPAGPAKWLASSVCTAALAVVGLLAALMGKDTGKRMLSPLSSVLLIFAFVYLCAAIASAWRGQSAHALAPWVNAILLALLAPGCCRRVADVERVLTAVVAAISLSSVYGMAQRFGYDPFVWSDTTRYEYTGLPATYGHPNFAGHALVLGIVLGLGLIARCVTERRGLLRGGMLLGCVALMALHLEYTGMRAGWLALAGAAGMVCLVLVLRHLLRERPHLLPGAMLGLLIAGAGVGVGLLRYALSRWPDARLDIDSSWILRLNGYLGSAEHFIDHPWRGAGPGRFRDAIVPYWTEFERRWFVLYDMRNNHAHNEILEAAVEAGLPGVAATLLLFLTALYVAIALTTAKERNARWFGLLGVGAMSAFLIDAQFGFNLHTPAASGLFFLLLGLLGRMSGGQDPASRGLRIASATLAAAMLIGMAVFSAMSFRAEWRMLRAQGGITWAAEQAPTRPDLSEKALRFVVAELEPVCVRPFAHAEAWDLLAQAQAKLEDVDAAAAAYRHAIARAPYDPKLLARTADFVLNHFPDADGLEEARQLAEAAVTLCPDLSEANLVMAQVLWKRHEAEAAKRPEPRTESVAALLAWRRGQYGEVFEIVREYAEHAAFFSATPSVEAWELVDSVSLTETGAGDERARRQAADLEPWKRERWQALSEVLPDDGAYRDALTSAYTDARAGWPEAEHLPELALALADLDAPKAAPFVRDALLLYPERLALWGAALEASGADAGLPELLELRAQLGTCDAERERQLAPWYALLDALEAQSVADTAKALEGLGALAGLMYDAEMPRIGEELGWIAGLTERCVRGWRLPPEETAALILRLADLCDRTEQPEAAERLAMEVVNLITGVERAGAVLLLSKASALRGDGATALKLAQQAAALAPYAVPVRWNLAVRLWEAGRTAEADFEFSSLVPQLNPATRDGRAKLERYEQFKQAATQEVTP